MQTRIGGMTSSLLRFRKRIIATEAGATGISSAALFSYCEHLLAIKDGTEFLYEKFHLLSEKYEFILHPLLLFISTFSWIISTLVTVYRVVLYTIVDLFPIHIPHIVADAVVILLLSDKVGSLLTRRQSRLTKKMINRFIPGASNALVGRVEGFDDHILRDSEAFLRRNNIGARKILSALIAVFVMILKSKIGGEKPKGIESLPPSLRVLLAASMTNLMMMARGKTHIYVIDNLLNTTTMSIYVFILLISLYEIDLIFRYS